MFYIDRTVQVNNVRDFKVESPNFEVVGYAGSQSVAIRAKFDSEEWVLGFLAPIGKVLPGITYQVFGPNNHYFVLTLSDKVVVYYPRWEELIDKIKDGPKINNDILVVEHCNITPAVSASVYSTVEDAAEFWRALLK